MPEPELVRQYRVKIEAVDAETVRLQWDGMDDVVPVASIFSTEVDEADLIHSLRCLLAIEGKVDPTAQSVLEAITRRGGIQTAARPVFVSGIVQNPDNETCLLTYGYTSADSSYGINFRLEELRERPKSVELLANQIGAKLRFARQTAIQQGLSPDPFSSLTPEAIRLIEDSVFRGF